MRFSPFAQFAICFFACLSALTDGMMSVISVWSRLRWPKSSLTALAKILGIVDEQRDRAVDAVAAHRGLSGIAAVKLAFCAASTSCMRVVSPATSWLIAVAMTHLPYICAADV